MLLPLAALVWSSRAGGLDEFWHQATQPEAVAALKLTLGLAAIVALVNAVTGTAIAWVLVRDRFPGRGLRRRGDRPAVRAADDRRGPDAAGALRPRRARSVIDVAFTRIGT